MESVFLLGEFTSAFLDHRPLLHILLIEWPICFGPVLFTWVLPKIYGYETGGMFTIGLIISIVAAAMPFLQFVHLPAWALYNHIYPWLYGIFFLYALLGFSLCSVGVYDGKRSAAWGLLGTFVFTGGAFMDAMIWLDVMDGNPHVPIGFAGFVLFTTMGYLRRPADRPDAPDLRESAERMKNNRTRKSRSIPRRLLREGNFHLLPLLYLVSLSDLGKEGIQNSGSYRFADHIYKNEPSGIGPIGRWLDRIFLQLPATRAFRNRYIRSQQTVRETLSSFPEDTEPLRWLAVPCGLPRDLKELAETLSEEDPGLLERIQYTGMDVDREVLQKAREFTKSLSAPEVNYREGNALLIDDYPDGSFHCVVSTGLGEFLNNEELNVFYGNVYEKLREGGVFYTSATNQEEMSDTLMRIFELETHYRTTDDLEEILNKYDWSQIKLVQHETGLQNFVEVTK